ncbi:hypothetical protein [Cystobacter ferrugineus]|uniref:Uncharacterized protein n=1 Tax=Cystobacter ferrugineus TaxID=83449 RepID=A0A1L9B2S8_9BACT|nr:hypothetical protein [Cystobacter ferrugineus]OJH36559.1 hypothetical protein BON30_32915 [Cystobacter ferrugineus]
MTMPQSPVLEFPEMLHGLTGAILRKVSTKGKEWAREYLTTGVFTQPRRMRQVLPGEVLIVHSGGDSNLIPQPRWRVHLFSDVFMYLDEGVPEQEYGRARDAFESFCLSTPWGALFHAVSPYPLRSAQRMARRLAALLRFWDVLQVPRYAFWFDREYTLDELVEDIYGMTLEAWCPGGAASVREHLALTVECMARASRADCMEAVLRVIPVLVRANADLQHREMLNDPDFLRERLDALRPDDFEDISSAYRFTVNGALYAWDRALGRQ